jgi:hypothetical protein
MSKKNPIEHFFSERNVLLLNQVLKEDIEKRLNVDIGNSYLEQLIETMKMVVRPIKRIPKDMPPVQVLKTLNQKVLIEALPIFINNLSQHQSTETGKEESTSLAIDPRANVPKANDPRITGSVEERFNQMVDNRQPQNVMPATIPNFEEPQLEFKERVDDLYEREEAERNGMINIPQMDPNDPNYQEFLQSISEQNANRASLQPIENENAPQTMNGTSMNGTSMNGTSMNGTSMNGTSMNGTSMNGTSMNGTSINGTSMNGTSMNGTSMNGAATNDGNMSSSISDLLQRGSDVASSAELNQQIYDSAAAQASQYSDSSQPFDAPMPAQMRTLIPRWSRNTIEDTDMIPQTLIIDSRRRDVRKYPEPNNYRIIFPAYKDVVQVSLAGAEIPVTGYTISRENNIIHFEEESGKMLTAALKPGNYQSDELACEIANKLTANSPNNIQYFVMNDQTQNKFTIISTAESPFIFNLRFFGREERTDEGSKILYLEGSVGPILGYSPKDLKGQMEYTAQGRYNLGGEQYLLMIIKELNQLHDDASHMDSAFAKIVLDVPLGDVKFYTPNFDARFIKFFSPEIGKFATVTVEFRTFDGRLYDFNGADHSFTLKILSKDITKPIY